MVTRKSNKTFLIGGNVSMMTQRKYSRWFILLLTSFLISNEFVYGMEPRVQNLGTLVRLGFHDSVSAFCQRLPVYVNCLYDGDTLLHKALQTHDLNMIIILLAVPGINVNQKNSCGYTPLHHASSMNFIEGARLLLSERADLLLEDLQKRLPVDIADEHCYFDMVELMRQHVSPQCCLPF